MEIENAGDLIYYTYFMLDFSKVKQAPSTQRCVTCGGPLKSLEPARDREGREFDGTVCHSCKTVLWVRR